MQNSNIQTQQPDMPVSEEIEAVMSLLSGEPEKAEVPVPEKDETPEEVTAEPEKAEDGNDAPEKDAIDYGMQVPITGGEPVTLGELKDLYQNQNAAKLELIERENSVLRQLEKSSMLLQYVDSLPDHIKQAAQQQAVVDYQQQMSILMDTIPEARTPEGAAAMRQSIYSLAAEYGVQRRDVDQIKNAVTIKMMHDFARLKASIKAAKDNVKPLRSTDAKATSGISKPTSELQQLSAKAKQTRNPQDEAAAVAALLRSA